MPKTLLGNPVPEAMQAGKKLPPETQKHIDEAKLKFTVDYITSPRFNFTPSELETLHDAWVEVFCSRGTAEADKAVKSIMKATYAENGVSVDPFIAGALRVWSMTEWNPKVPEELRPARKTYRDEIRCIAAILKKQGLVWIDEYREWYRLDKEKNAYVKMLNQQEAVQMGLDIVNRQAELASHNYAVSADTDFMKLLAIMDGAKCNIENQLKSALNVNVAQFAEQKYYELCTPAGTYDLRTGKLVRKDNGMTLAVTEVAPDFDKKHWTNSMFKKVLETSLPDPEKRDYLQRAIGFSLYGLIEGGQDPLLHIWEGKHGAGTSSIFNPIDAALGTYASKALDVKVFTTSSADMHKQHEKAQLFGKRFALTNELDDTTWLAADTLKGIVSKDPIMAEEKYKKSFEFKNNCSVHMLTNHLPQIKNVEDKAVRTRIRVCEFTESFVDDNRVPLKGNKLHNIDTALAHEHAIILGWAIRGAARLAKDDFYLIPTPAILADTEKYFHEYDWIQEFIDAECEKDESTKDCMVSLSTLFIRFQKWGELTGNRFHSMNNVQFSKRLRAKFQDNKEILIKRIGRAGTVSVIGLSLRMGTDAAKALDRQIYGMEGCNPNREADLEEAKEIAKEREPKPVQAPKPTRDPLLEVDPDSLGQLIDDKIPEARQEEIAREATRTDTPERAIRKAVERRSPDTMAHLSTLLEDAGKTALTPDDETVLYLAWCAIQTAKQNAEGCEENA